MIAPSTCRFGNVLIDVNRREIRVGGEVVRTQPRVFDVLHYLITHRDRVVDKDELLEKLWPGIVVTEASLTQALMKARKIVGDDGERQAVIRTIQRRGFRFVAVLEELTTVEATGPNSAGASPAPGGQPAKDDECAVATTHSLASASPAREASVAVLPFIDMSATRDQEHFCDGMTEEIINALTRVAGLRVAARTSSFAFKSRSEDVRNIAATLGVSTIVEGSVRRGEDRLRVTAQLIDSTTGFHRWSERWDRPLNDVFTVQEEIATRVAEALKEHLTIADRDAISTFRARELSAYDFYLRGLEYRRQYGRRNQRYAAEMFRRSLAIDPAYAPAWAGLATSYMLLFHASASEEYRQLAADAGARAAQIDLLSAEVQLARAITADLGGDFAVAEQAFSRAEQLSPRLFDVWYFHGRACSMRGEHARAAELLERAASLRPEDFEIQMLAEQCYRVLGQTEQALKARHRAAELAERAVALDPSDVRALSLGCGALLLLGRHDQARQWLRAACALEPDEPDVRYNAACAHAMLGEHECALALLEALEGDRDTNLAWTEHDAWLDPLRGYERFERLFRRS